MALSNIFREPRREITESVLGIVPAILIGWIDWQFACWFQGSIMPADKTFRLVGCLFGLVLIGASIFIPYGILLLTHSWGESICNALARRGLELRPKRRFN